MNQLEMLTQREQLMWDIDGIVEEFFVSTWGDEYGEDMEQLIRVLCDTVCKNFPAKWHKLVGCPTSWQGVTTRPPYLLTLCL